MASSSWWAYVAMRITSMSESSHRGISARSTRPMSTMVAMRMAPGSTTRARSASSQKRQGPTALRSKMPSFVLYPISI